MNTTDDNMLPVPHFAVIFSNQRGEGNEELYEETAAAMVNLASQQPGYLSHESVRGEDGFGITISYWSDEASIKAWKENVDHLAAQRAGFETFYERFTLRIARVESLRTWRKG